MSFVLSHFFSVKKNLFLEESESYRCYVHVWRNGQIRSHAQKYFLKVQKSGANEHLPPPRPKRKARHPYPQKAPKNGIFFSHLLASHSLIVFVLLSDGFTMLQFLSPPTPLVPSLLQTHPCFNLLTCTALLIHSHFWETLPLALLL